MLNICLKQGNCLPFKSDTLSTHPSSSLREVCRSKITSPDFFLYCLAFSLERKHNVVLGLLLSFILALTFSEKNPSPTVTLLQK